MKSTTIQILLIASIFGLFIFSGCEVSSEKIASWKQSERGAPKLRAVVRDRGQTIAIRCEAAEGLGELSLFSALSEDIKSLGDQDKQQLLSTLIPRLLKQMKGAIAGSTTRPQLCAKDTLFSVREFAAGTQQSEIDHEIVAWILDDWSKRSTGEHSAEKIISTIGKSVSLLLAERLEREDAPLIEWSVMLGKLGDPQAREQGAQNLIKLMEKSKTPTPAMVQALGNLGSEAAGKKLISLVKKKGELEPRLHALRALALAPTASVIEPMKELALDKTLKEDEAVLRDEAFSVLEKINDPRALAALVSLLNASEEMVRYRVVEAIIDGHKEKGLRNLLEGLSPGYTYKRQDLADFVQKDIIDKIGRAALPILREELNSANLVAKLVAISTLGALGTSEDIASLEKLSTDKTKAKNVTGATTIGDEARAALELIKKHK